MKDDSKPCEECGGRGFKNPFGGKKEWTNAQWAEHRKAEVNGPG
jgi:hypothetical protein